MKLAVPRSLCSAVVGIVFALGLAFPKEPGDAEESYGGYSLSDSRVQRHVLGNTLWTVLHWMSHAIIDSESRPVSGDMEVTADELATLLLIEVHNGDQENAGRAINTMLGLTGQVISWVAHAESSQGKSKASEPVTEWGGHQLTLERYRTVVCILFGRNPKVFGQLLLWGYWPPAPQVGSGECRDKYERIRATWIDILIPFEKSQAESSDAARAGRVTVEFQPTSDVRLDELRALVVNSELITRLAARLSASHAMKQDIRLVFKECGAPDTNWEKNERRITVCYELLSTFPRWAYE